MFANLVTVLSLIFFLNVYSFYLFVYQVETVLFCLNNTGGVVIHHVKAVYSVTFFLPIYHELTINILIFHYFQGGLRVLFLVYEASKLG